MGFILIPVQVIPVLTVLFVRMNVHATCTYLRKKEDADTHMYSGLRILKSIILHTQTENDLVHTRSLLRIQ